MKKYIYYERWTKIQSLVQKNTYNFKIPKKYDRISFKKIVQMKGNEIENMEGWKTSQLLPEE